MSILEKEIAMDLWANMTDTERDEYIATMYTGHGVYKKEMELQLVEHMAQGRSYESFAAVVGVSRQALVNWESKYPSWYAAKKLAFVKALYYWEDIALQATEPDAKRNATMIIFSMKSKFPDLYADNVQVRHSGQVGMVAIDTGIRRDSCIEAEFTNLDQKVELL